MVTVAATMVAMAVAVAVVAVLVVEGSAGVGGGDNVVERISWIGVLHLKKLELIYLSKKM